ncbi:MAG: sigma 54-interacting transcriptional regulator [Planctomycetota bacterium]
MSLRILVAVSDAAEREAIARMLVAAGAHVAEACDIAQARDRAEREAWDFLFSDLHFPDGTGFELLGAGRCVLLHSFEEDRLPRQLRRAGAYAACRKPVTPERISLLLGHSRAESGLPGMVGRAPAMQELFERVRKVGSSHATVLVEGESGTGKELVARAIHALSPRADGPFVAVNCAALSPNLLESELFGHEKGAFTGAHKARAGRFELADGGTLLLDEIGEMDPALQAKLLRALEEMEVVRVGGNTPISVDVRVIAATNRSLRRRVEEGAFREDLFYRLHVIRIEVPPLRERRGDIPLLVDWMVDELAALHNLPRPPVGEEAIRRLAAAPWPGNVRELRNLVERVLLLTPGGEIGAGDLPADLGGSEESSGGGLTMRPIAEVERELIRNTLRDLDGNREKAARVLGISTRTLYRRIKELGLS